MDARLTDEHSQVQETARDFLESNGGIEYARRAMEGEDVIDEVWAEISALDFTAITVPIAHGGLGEGMVYLAALLESLGRYAMPGPYPETMAFGVPLLASLQNGDAQADVLSAVAAGEERLSFALYDEHDETVPEAITMQATRVDDGYELDGTKTLVPYGGSVDSLIVATRTQDATGFDGISLVLVDADRVEATELDSLDRTRPMYEVTFPSLVVDEADIIGGRHTAGAALSGAIDRFNVATSAMLVGAAEQAVDLSVEYGNEREQYGQPIGRFQAVKHRTADMWMDTQHLRSLTYYAAWAIENDEPDATHAASRAKAFAADHGPRIFTDDIWNHGGMGFTWDHDAHIYMKQAKAWENFLGGADYHYDRVADERDYSRRLLPNYPADGARQ